MDMHIGGEMFVNSRNVGGGWLVFQEQQLVVMVIKPSPLPSALQWHSNRELVHGQE